MGLEHAGHHARPRERVEHPQAIAAEFGLHRHDRLFERPEDVDRWIDEVFVRGFRERVGAEEPDGSKLTGVETLEVGGFHERASALLVVHEAPEGTVLASTVVDFRLGRLLGVAYVVAKRDKAYVDLATELGAALERQMVRVVLDA